MGFDLCVQKLARESPRLPLQHVLVKIMLSCKIQLSCLANEQKQTAFCQQDCQFFSKLSLIPVSRADTIMMTLIVAMVAAHRVDHRFIRCIEEFWSLHKKKK